MAAITAFPQEKDPFKEEKSDDSLAQEDDTFKVFPDPAGQEYFPKGEALFYTKYLAAMKEPSVKAPLKKGVERVLRFTYLRSFHDPLVIRVVQKGEILTTRAVKLKMEPGYKPGKILYDKTWILKEANSKLVRSLLRQKDFWKPLNAAEQEINIGLDGSQWIFEVHDKTGYRIISVWSPEASTFTDKELKEFGLDKTKLRDFMVYQKTGNQLLKIGRILPNPEENY